jgi:acetate kinase
LSSTYILVLNSGSSSIKFSIYHSGSPGNSGAELFCVVDGELTGVGSEHAELTIKPVGGRSVAAKGQDEAIAVVLDTISGAAFPSIDAVGYRVVHPGPSLKRHQRITPEVLKALEAAKGYAPLHDPEALDIIHRTMERFPALPHFVCFDTVFHETMPQEATVYALPESIRNQGVRRYGFHGLSCESVVRQLRAAGELPRRLVIAHLGSGCSVTAVLDGRSVDNTMGMTPTGGVVMGTRVGDLDPGVVLYLLRAQGAATTEAAAMVEGTLNHEAGMVGLSGMANDVKAMRAAAESGDDRAQLALHVFTRSVTKAIGGYCFLLGGLDAIVFAGGIGEHDERSRTEILAGLEELGIQLGQPFARTGSVRRVSPESSKTAVYVVPADEDQMIALHVASMAQTSGHGQPLD